jgi:hypothetical protein
MIVQRIVVGPEYFMEADFYAPMDESAPRIALAADDVMAHEIVEVGVNVVLNDAA